MNKKFEKIKKSLRNELNIEKSKIDKLNEKAQRLFDDIQLSETSFESLENTISSFTDPVLITEGYKILESFKLEIDDNKKEYRNLIGLIQKYV